MLISSLLPPRPADLIAKMAAGLADDLATNVLLATNKPVLIAPRHEPDDVGASGHGAQMSHGLKRPASRRSDRMSARWRSAANSARAAWPSRWRSSARSNHISARRLSRRSLSPGATSVITSGPTHEPIDPVRYIANRSSGKQGHAIAAAALKAGARVTLVAGPVTLPDPAGADVVHVETARQMLTAGRGGAAGRYRDLRCSPSPIGEWDGQSSEKIKKGASGTPDLHLVENPDILATIGHHPSLRPKLVIGFAAETQNLVENAQAKLRKKGADFIVANDVSPATGIMGGDRNMVRIVGHDGIEDWPEGSKDEVARALIARAASYFS